MKILTAAEMREVDHLTTERYSVPGVLLMENAAARTAEVIEKKLGPVSNRRALIICGKGNNGGDGAAIARLIHTKGAAVDVLLLGRAEDARGDARTNFEITRRLAAASAQFRFVEIENPDQLRSEAAAATHDILIDAIFGTGLARPAAGLFEEAIRLINQLRDEMTVVAVDIPSGVASDSQELIGPAVRAHLTVTFTAPKIANVLPPASDSSCELVITRIGSPDELINSSGSHLNLVCSSDVRAWLDSSRRSAHANKGNAGKALIVAGSRGKTGAACLAGEGAMRAGAGLVT